MEIRINKDLNLIIINKVLFSFYLTGDSSACGKCIYLRKEKSIGDCNRFFTDVSEDELGDMISLDVGNVCYSLSIFNKGLKNIPVDPRNITLRKKYSDSLFLSSYIFNKGLSFIYQTTYQYGYK